MKKIFKKSFIVLLTALMLSSIFSVSVFALGDCRVKIHLVDYTNGDFKDTVTVYYYNEELNLTYRAKLDYEDYAFDVRASSTIKNGDYKLTIEYESTDDYEIKNADGSDISLELDASGTSHTFEWVVIAKGAKLPSENESSEADSPSSPELNNGVDINEGKRIWDKYLMVFEPLSYENTDYSRILRYGEGEQKAAQFQSVTGRSKDEYEQMTPYDKYLWTVAYIAPAYYSGNMSNVTYTTWRDSPISASKRYIASSGATQEMIEIHTEMLEWSYKYFAATGEVFNFIEGFDDYELEEDNSVEVSDDDTDSSSEAASDVIVPSKKPNASNDATSSDNGTEEKEGIWGGVMSYIQGHVLTLALLLVLAIAVVVIVVYRKRKTIEDEE